MMARAALILALASLLTSCAKDGSRSSEDPPTVDERAGVLAGVRFGDTAGAIRQRLGEPTDGKPGFFPTGDDYTGPPAIPSPAADQGRPPVPPTELHYEDLAVLVSRRVGAFSMATLAEGARTRAGVAVGDDLGRVRERYERVTCGEQVSGEPLLGGEPPKYRWCRTVVAGVRVFFGGDPVESITLTHYPPNS
jgi:hypothetical protein